MCGVRRCAPEDTHYIHLELPLPYATRARESGCHAHPPARCQEAFLRSCCRIRMGGTPFLPRTRRSSTSWSKQRLLVLEHDSAVDINMGIASLSDPDAADVKRLRSIRSYHSKVSKVCNCDDVSTFDASSVHCPSADQTPGMQCGVIAPLSQRRAAYNSHAGVCATQRSYIYVVRTQLADMCRRERRRYSTRHEDMSGNDQPHAGDATCTSAWRSAAGEAPSNGSPGSATWYQAERPSRTTGEGDGVAPCHMMRVYR